MVYDVWRYPLDGDAQTDGHPVTYGFNELRPIEPVYAGERVRAGFTVADVTEGKPGQMLMTLETFVEVEGKEKPALIADLLAS